MRQSSIAATLPAAGRLQVGPPGGWAGPSAGAGPGCGAEDGATAGCLGKTCGLKAAASGIDKPPVSTGRGNYEWQCSGDLQVATSGEREMPWGPAQTGP